MSYLFILLTVYFTEKLCQVLKNIYFTFKCVYMCVCAHLTAGDSRDQIHQIPVEMVLQVDLGAGSQTWVRSVSISFTCECVIMPASFVKRPSFLH